VAGKGQGSTASADCNDRKEYDWRCITVTPWCLSHGRRPDTLLLGFEVVGETKIGWQLFAVRRLRIDTSMPHHSTAIMFLA